MAENAEDKPKPKPPPPSKPNKPSEQKGGDTPGGKATAPKPQTPEKPGGTK